MAACRSALWAGLPVFSIGTAASAPDHETMNEKTARPPQPAELEQLKNSQSVLWVNPLLRPDAKLSEPVGVRSTGAMGLDESSLADADARWNRFAPLLEKLFPELRESHGIIESPLVEAGGFRRVLADRYGLDVQGRLFVKCDADLAVAGSIKARGGIYAVLCFAEQVALKEGLIRETRDRPHFSAAGKWGLSLVSPEAREVFSRYELSVGSTGNLGMSIGIMGSALGFAVTVHMSREAKQWKKDRLRSLGVRVVEHATDYTAACVEARKIAAANPRNHFIDDENSVELFLGYSVAALRTAEQLRRAGFTPDDDHPLFVYLPCGVGGAPGGITFGLKQVFGPAVHCFFAEPTGAPCMTLGMMTGRHSAVSLYDEGIALRTQADGLAVSRPSQFVGQIMEAMLAGCYTLSDERMVRYVADLYESEKLKVELSAAAGCAGPEMVLATAAGREYLRRRGLEGKLRQAAHVIWTTGGRFLPAEEFQKLLDAARKT
jgi:D-serine dehydratase